MKTLKLLPFGARQFITSSVFEQILAVRGKNIFFSVNLWGLRTTPTCKSLKISIYLPFFCEFKKRFDNEQNHQT